jgi:hypothetical protein
MKFRSITAPVVEYWLTTEEGGSSGTLRGPNHQSLTTSAPSPTVASCLIDIEVLQYYINSMKVTVEMSEEELKDILKVTCEKRKGAAIRQLALEALMLKKRRELLDEVDAGKWSVDLPPIERLREDRNLWRS